MVKLLSKKLLMLPWEELKSLAEVLREELTSEDCKIADNDVCYNSS